MASGKFWVWSVTHADVKAALTPELRTDLDSPLIRMNRHARVMAVAADPAFLALHAVAQLLRYLAMPPEIAEAYLIRNATGITASMIHPPDDSRGAQALADTMETFWSRLPDWMREYDEKASVWAASRAGAMPAVFLRWPRGLMTGALQGVRTPGVVLLDEATAADEAELVSHWRYWLGLFNLLQVLPGLLLTTQTGLDARDYDTLMSAPRRNWPGSTGRSCCWWSTGSSTRMAGSGRVGP